MARTRATDYGKKRLGILHRSAELFARHGFTGTSITMIAKACGVSKALLYHYYTSKDEILFDLLNEHLQHLVEVLEQASTSTGAPDVRLYAIADALLEAYRGADAEHQVQISSLKLLAPAQQNSLKAIERRMVEIVGDTLAAALPSIASQRDILMPLTMSFFAMLNWHYLWFRDDRGLTRQQYARMATALVLSGARASADEATDKTTRRKPAAKSVSAMASTSQ